jgi:hypothetical protein
MTNNCKVTFVDNSTLTLSWKDEEGNNITYEGAYGLVSYPNGLGSSYTYWPWPQIKQVTWGE